MRFPSFLAASLLALTAATAQPGPGQRQLIERGYGMFIHFGVNTFNQVEWSDGNLPASSFNPTALDCDQWIQTAKEAGFRHVILITKHHDGFCLWDSKFTDYDVASSPCKSDIVAEVAKACRKYDIKLGLYYSLWDRHEPTHGDKDPAKYVDYMKNQLTDGFSQQRNFSIQEYAIDGLNAGEWKTLHSGTEIGAAKIIRFDKKITAEKLRLRVTKASAPPSIYRIAVADGVTKGLR